MSVKMELGNSKSQAASCAHAAQTLISSLSSLSKTVEQVEGLGDSLKGLGATNAKSYAIEHVVPTIQAGVLLVDKIMRAVTNLPEKYVQTVDSKSHDSDKLEEKIREIKNQITNLDHIAESAKNIPGAGGLLGFIKNANNSNNMQMTRLREILDHLLGFDAVSDSLFDEIGNLKKAFDTGVSQVCHGFICGSQSVGGCFDTKQSTSWEKYVRKEWRNFDETSKNKSDGFSWKKIKGSIKGLLVGFLGPYVSDKIQDKLEDVALKGGAKASGFIRDLFRSKAIADIIKGSGSKYSENIDISLSNAFETLRSGLEDLTVAKDAYDGFKILDHRVVLLNMGVDFIKQIPADHNTLFDAGYKGVVDGTIDSTIPLINATGDLTHGHVKGAIREMINSKEADNLDETFNNWYDKNVRPEKQKIKAINNRAVINGYVK